MTTADTWVYCVCDPMAMADALKDPGCQPRCAIPLSACGPSGAADQACVTHVMITAIRASRRAPAGYAVTFSAPWRTGQGFGDGA